MASNYLKAMNYSLLSSSDDDESSLIMKNEIGFYQYGWIWEISKIQSWNFRIVFHDGNIFWFNNRIDMSNFSEELENYHARRGHMSSAILYLMKRVMKDYQMTSRAFVLYDKINNIFIVESLKTGSETKIMNSENEERIKISDLPKVNRQIIFPYDIIVRYRQSEEASRCVDLYQRMSLLSGVVLEEIENVPMTEILFENSFTSLRDSPTLANSKKIELRFRRLQNCLKVSHTGMVDIHPFKKPTGGKSLAKITLLKNHKKNEKFITNCLTDTTADIPNEEIIRKELGIYEIINDALSSENESDTSEQMELSISSEENHRSSSYDTEDCVGSNAEATTAINVSNDTRIIQTSGVYPLSHYTGNISVFDPIIKSFPLKTVRSLQNNAEPSSYWKPRNNNNAPISTSVLILKKKNSNQTESQTPGISSVANIAQFSISTINAKLDYNPNITYMYNLSQHSSGKKYDYADEPYKGDEFSRESISTYKTTDDFLSAELSVSANVECVSSEYLEADYIAINKNQVVDDYLSHASSIDKVYHIITSHVNINYEINQCFLNSCKVLSNAYVKKMERKSISEKFLKDAMNRKLLSIDQPSSNETTLLPVVVLERSLPAQQILSVMTTVEKEKQLPAEESSSSKPIKPELISSSCKITSEKINSIKTTSQIVESSDTSRTRRKTESETYEEIIQKAIDEVSNYSEDTDFSEDESLTMRTTRSCLSCSSTGSRYKLRSRSVGSYNTSGDDSSDLDFGFFTETSRSESNIAVQSARRNKKKKIRLLSSFDDSLSDFEYYPNSISGSSNVSSRSLNNLLIDLHDTNTKRQYLVPYKIGEIQSLKKSFSKPIKQSSLCARHPDFIATDTQNNSNIENNNSLKVKTDKKLSKTNVEILQSKKQANKKGKKCNKYSNADNSNSNNRESVRTNMYPTKRKYKKADSDTDLSLCSRSSSSLNSSASLPVNRSRHPLPVSTFMSQGTLQKATIHKTSSKPTASKTKTEPKNIKHKCQVEKSSSRVKKPRYKMDQYKSKQLGNHEKLFDKIDVSIQKENKTDMLPYPENNHFVSSSFEKVEQSVLNLPLEQNFKDLGTELVSIQPCCSAVNFLEKPLSTSDNISTNTENSLDKENENDMINNKNNSYLKDIDNLILNMKSKKQANINTEKTNKSTKALPSSRIDIKGILKNKRAKRVTFKEQNSAELSASSETENIRFKNNDTSKILPSLDKLVKHLSLSSDNISLKSEDVKVSLGSQKKANEITGSKRKQENFSCGIKKPRRENKDAVSNKNKRTGKSTTYPYIQKENNLTPLLSCEHSYALRTNFEDSKRQVTKLNNSNISEAHDMSKLPVTKPNTRKQRENVLKSDLKVDTGITRKQKRNNLVEITARNVSNTTEKVLYSENKRKKNFENAVPLYTCTTIATNAADKDMPNSCQDTDVSLKIKRLRLLFPDKNVKKASEGETNKVNECSPIYKMGQTAQKNILHYVDAQKNDNLVNKVTILPTKQIQEEVTVCDVLKKFEKSRITPSIIEDSVVKSPDCNNLSATEVEVAPENERINAVEKVAPKLLDQDKVLDMCHRNGYIMTLTKQHISFYKWKTGSMLQKGSYTFKGAIGREIQPKCQFLEQRTNHTSYNAKTRVVSFFQVFINQSDSKAVVFIYTCGPRVLPSKPSKFLIKLDSCFLFSVVYTVVPTNFQFTIGYTLLEGKQPFEIKIYVHDPKSILPNVIRLPSIEYVCQHLDIVNISMNDEEKKLMIAGYAAGRLTIWNFEKQQIYLKMSEPALDTLPSTIPDIIKKGQCVWMNICLDDEGVDEPMAYVVLWDQIKRQIYLVSLKFNHEYKIIKKQDVQRHYQNLISITFGNAILCAIFKEGTLIFNWSTENGSTTLLQKLPGEVFGRGHTVVFNNFSTRSMNDIDMEHFILYNNNNSNAQISNK